MDFRHNSSLQNNTTRNKERGLKTMYKSEFKYIDNLSIEIIKHNNHIIIEDENYNKLTFIDYTIKQAINEFKKTYK